MPDYLTDKNKPGSPKALAADKKESPQQLWFEMERHREQEEGNESRDCGGSTYLNTMLLYNNGDRGFVRRSASAARSLPQDARTRRSTQVTF
ncbi:hypothetical protein INR49_027148 [Caranx melampygus]|nr:hypothetical protein INR49_027148 [Caranx melampygus]